MTNTEIFKVNSPQVVCETIDGEVVIVNLEQGHYYSLLGTGVKIWEGIEQSLCRQDLLEMILNLYDGNYEEIARSVHGFIEILQKEGLICLNSDNGLTGERSESSQVINSTSEKLSFEIPTLEKYSDMEDLLLIDPIHEVADTGWPNTKPEI